MQTLLAPDQISEFYLDCFAADQVAHFQEMVPAESLDAAKVVVDVGGGCGFFALQLHKQTKRRTRVMDTDPVSVGACRKLRIDAVIGDALLPPIIGDEEIVCFNLILHHLVSTTELSTRELQKCALAAWLNRAKYLFVNELHL